MWYSSGTIQVAANGTTATGTGTQFLGNARIGDGLAIQGSATLHEITGISSNTQLTFSPPYAGTTGSGKAFRIVPVLGYDKDLSDAFNALRLQFGDQLSNLQPWATAPTQDAAQTALGMSATGKAVVAGTPEQARTAIGAASEAGLKQASPSILIVDQLRRSVEVASGGRQTVIYTAKGQPCHMYVLPRFLCEDIAPGGELGTGTHPAFLFNGTPAQEIFIAAHLASEVAGEAISRPFADPRTGLNFDQSRAMCQANGPGWDLMSNLDWAALSLWCMANGHQPRGNTNWGRHHDRRWETGRRVDTLAPGTESGNGRTLTGSGPASWAHDGTPAGIQDLVGNVWEWVTGLKLIDGVINLAPDNGVYTEAAYTNTGFVMPQNGYTFWGQPNAGASNLVKQSLIVPASAALAPIGYYDRAPTGERLPRRGGGWRSSPNAGLGALALDYARTDANSNIGFRPRFRNP